MALALLPCVTTQALQNAGFSVGELGLKVTGAGGVLIKATGGTTRLSILPNAGTFAWFTDKWALTSTGLMIAKPSSTTGTGWTITPTTTSGIGTFFDFSALTTGDGLKIKYSTPLTGTGCAFNVYDGTTSVFNIADAGLVTMTGTLSIGGGITAPAGVTAAVGTPITMVAGAGTGGTTTGYAGGAVTSTGGAGSAGTTTGGVGGALAFTAGAGGAGTTGGAGGALTFGSGAGGTGGSAAAGALTIKVGATTVISSTAAQGAAGNTRINPLRSIATTIGGAALSGASVAPTVAADPSGSVFVLTNATPAVTLPAAGAANAGVTWTFVNGGVGTTSFTVGSAAADIIANAADAGSVTCQTLVWSTASHIVGVSAIMTSTGAKWILVSENAIPTTHT